MMRDNSSDAVLWDDVRQDDTRAFSILFERYWSKIFTTSFSYIKDREACSEITHDIFLNLWLKRKELQIVSFQAYLTAAARYHTYRHLRTAKLSAIKYQDDLEALEGSSENNSGDERIQSQELESQLNAYLNGLPRRCREIFVMSRKEHLSNSEIADKLGISKRTVENQLTYALRHLRMSLKDVSVLLIISSTLR